MNITPITVTSKSIMSSPGFRSKRVSFYNQPGNYQWQKTLDSSGKELPALITIEVCGGGGGGSSGVAILSNTFSKVGASGASGGGASISYHKQFLSYELNQTINITVGAGGAGGIAPTKSGYESIVNGADGQNGEETIVGPINVKNDKLVSKPGPGAYYFIGEDYVSSNGGNEFAGFCGRFVSNEARPTGLPTNEMTWGGAAGSNFELAVDGSYVYKEAGTTNFENENGGSSVALPSGRYLGKAGSDALNYGSGGSGGGITIAASADSEGFTAGNGGNGKHGFVKITTHISADTVFVK